MKILIVNKFLYPNGGSETYIFEIGKQLQKMGHEVQYFGMEHEGRVVGNRAESYTSNMDFHTGKLAKLLYPFKIIYSKEARQKIRVVLDDFKPDVVHLNNFTYTCFHQLCNFTGLQIFVFLIKNRFQIMQLHFQRSTSILIQNLKAINQSKWYNWSF